MASPKKTSATPRRSSTTRTTSTPAKTTAQRTTAPSPASYATRVKPVKTIPTGPVVRSKTLANGQPRPKSRRSK